MDPVRNPFAPGAGSQPPELAGREEVLRAADIAMKRVLIGNHSKSQILLGLRGVGKTVLLRKFENMSSEIGYQTSFIEAPENQSLANLLYPRILQVLRKLSLVEAAKAHAHAALKTLRSFASVFKVSMGDYSLEVDGEPGSADSGLLEYDLGELFCRVGDTAKAASKGWAIFIDEVQYLSSADLSALIVALHTTNQKNLPVLFFGAGLPQVAALTGDSKSYSERLFDYPLIDKLDRASAETAIREPITQQEESISREALEKIVELTKGYPFFLQEWGYQVWNFAESSPIKPEDVVSATPEALRRLDESFFRVRFDRLTPKERDYVCAMAKIGPGPYRSSDVAAKLGETVQSLGPCRAQIISKGMIYSPSHGDIAFTVPLFEEYLARTQNLSG